MADDFIPAGGTALVLEWLEELASPSPGTFIWEALDEDLRLAFTQGWMMDRAHDVVSDRDAEAAKLADAASSHELFPELFRDTVAHLSGVYEHLDGRPALVDVTDIVSVDMELVMVASNDLAGDYPEGARLPVHCFITRWVNGAWKIAANARRLPVPGWPPTEVKVEGLSID